MKYGKKKIIIQDIGYVTREKHRVNLEGLLENVNRAYEDSKETNDNLKAEIAMLRKGYHRLGRENQELKKKLKDTEKEKDQINEYYNDLLSSQ